MAAGGRKPFAQELGIRERIDTLSLRGMGPSEIRNALASSQNTEPISLSLRQVNRYLAEVRRERVQRLDPAVREQGFADLLAHTNDVIGVAAASSARYRESAHGVGYLNTEIKAITLAAKLQGFDSPAPTAAAGSVAPDSHLLDALSGAEQSAQFARWADMTKEST